MARINIEDSLFKDPRFMNLCIKMGDSQAALGALVWAFIVAQKFFLNEETDRLIPLNEWKKNLCSPLLIDAGLVEKRDQGYYVCGSEKQFAWLIQRVEAGRKGGIGGRSIYANMTDEDRRLRDKARRAVGNAVQRGRLIKPEVCGGCGVACNPEAHHSDYSKPFDITWVCKKCHHELHDKLLKIKDSGETIAAVKREEAIAVRDEAVAKPLNSLLLSPSSMLATQPLRPQQSRAEQIPITPDQLTQAFNEKSRGLLEPAVGLGRGGHFQNFIHTCQMLNTREKWEGLLQKAYDQREVLTKRMKTPLTLTWLVMEENAIKVLEGKYSQSLAMEQDEFAAFTGGAKFD